MSHVFSDLEGLRIAVEMERRGEAFYRRAAKISKSPETVALLNQLMEDEKRHGAEFQRLYDLGQGHAFLIGGNELQYIDGFDNSVVHILIRLFYVNYCVKPGRFARQVIINL